MEKSLVKELQKNIPEDIDIEKLPTLVDIMKDPTKNFQIEMLIHA